MLEDTNHGKAKTALRKTTTHAIPENSGLTIKKMTINATTRLSDAIMQLSKAIVQLIIKPINGAKPQS
jgi:hypothetical protein